MAEILYIADKIAAMRERTDEMSEFYTNNKRASRRRMHNEQIWIRHRIWSPERPYRNHLLLDDQHCRESIDHRPALALGRVVSRFQ
jgi:hypothetical protein